MDTFLNTLHDLFPLLGILLLVIGIKIDRISYIIVALWVSLIALLLHYQTAGGEILGSYFGYKNAAIYSLNLLVLITTLICLYLNLPIKQRKKLHILSIVVSVCLIIGCLLLMINLWINAVFIENKRPGTPILQVATFSSLPYCSYRYVFYKITVDGKIGYLCPDHYGLVPSVGTLDATPDFILQHLGNDIKESQHK
jgi:hypothetical protein